MKVTDPRSFSGMTFGTKVFDHSHWITCIDYSQKLVDGKFLDDDSYHTIHIVYLTSHAMCCVPYNSVDQ